MSTESFTSAIELIILIPQMETTAQHPNLSRQMMPMFAPIPAEFKLAHHSNTIHILESFNEDISGNIRNH